MKKDSIMTSLQIALLLMSVTYIFITIKKQQVFDLTFNIIYVFINIFYYILEIIPEDE